MIEITQEEIFQINQTKYNNRYETICTLASGAFGTVIKSKDKETNNIVAVKVLSKEKYEKSALTQLRREVGVLKMSNHPNIVKFYDFYETEDKIYIIMEYIKNGTLRDYMDKNKSITEKEAKTIIYYLLQAVEYLHKLDICHRDIKPENIMLCDDSNFSSLKVIDFGLSTKLEKNEKSFCGTVKYMAPEIFLNENYSKKVDIWSIGIICYMLLNDSCHPIYVKGDTKQVFASKLVENTTIVMKKKTVSRLAKNMLSHLLERDPKARYTAEMALKHRWFLEVISPTAAEKDRMLERREIKQKCINLLLCTLFLDHFKKNPAALDNRTEESCCDSTTDKDHTFSREGGDDSDIIQKRNLFNTSREPGYKINVKLGPYKESLIKNAKTLRPESRDTVYPLRKTKSNFSRKIIAKSDKNVTRYLLGDNLVKKKIHIPAGFDLQHKKYNFIPHPNNLIHTKRTFEKGEGIKRYFLMGSKENSMRTSAMGKGFQKSHHEKKLILPTIV